MRVSRMASEVWLCATRASKSSSKARLLKWEVSKGSMTEDSSGGWSRHGGCGARGLSHTPFRRTPGRAGGTKKRRPSLFRLCAVSRPEDRPGRTRVRLGQAPAPPARCARRGRQVKSLVQTGDTGDGSDRGHALQRHPCARSTLAPICPVATLFLEAECRRRCRRARFLLRRREPIVVPESASEPRRTRTQEQAMTNGVTPSSKARPEPHAKA